MTSAVPPEACAVQRLPGLAHKSSSYIARGADSGNTVRSFVYAARDVLRLRFAAGASDWCSKCDVRLADAQSQSRGGEYRLREPAAQKLYTMDGQSLQSAAPQVPSGSPKSLTAQPIQSKLVGNWPYQCQI